MRLLSLIFLGLFWAQSLWAAPQLLLISPKKIRLGHYGTITARGLALSPEENQVFIRPQGFTEAVTLPVTKVAQTPRTDIQRLTFVLSPTIFEQIPRRPLSAELWVVSNGESSNKLSILIIPAPVISEVSPASAFAGDELEVTLKVANMRLRSRGLSLNLGPGIEVKDLSVASSDTLTALLKIDEKAQNGKRNITLRLGRLVVRGYELFEVLAPARPSITVEVNSPPQVVFTPAVTIQGSVNTAPGGETLSPPPPPALITGLSPASGSQGQELVLRITGQNTHFSQGKTELLLGSAITVKDLKVLDETHLEATIAISPEAPIGPYSLRVVTGEEIAPCVLAFNVTKGVGIIKGYVKDSQTKAPLARVRISLPDYQLVTYTNQEGYFELRNVPSGKAELYFSLPNYEGLKLDLKVKAGQTIDLTQLLSGPEEQAGVFLKPIVQQGEIPGTHLEALLSQGLTQFKAPEAREEAQKKVINAIVGLGGSEMGVIDENGEQLNPQIEGEGIVSLLPGKIEELTDYWQMGETYSIGEVLYFITNLLVWENNKKPTLGVWLEVLNQAISEIWNNPQNDAYELVRFLFSHSKQAPDNPPTISADFRFNAIQAFMFIHVFLIPYVEEHTAYIPNKTYMLASYWGENQVVSDGMFLLAQNESSDNSSSDSSSKDSTEKPFSALAVTMKDFLDKKGLEIVQDELSTDFLKKCIEGDPTGSNIAQLLIGTKVHDVFAALIRKEAASYFDYLNYLAKSNNEQAKKLAEWLKNNIDDPERLKEYIEIGVPDINDAAKYAGKIMKGLWQPFVSAYKMTVIEMATPLPPIIDKVEYHYGPDNNVDGLKITFYPSRTEERVIRLREERNSDYPVLFYVLYRIDNTGTYIVGWKKFTEIPKDKDGLYYFIDRSAPLGIVRYRMIAIAKWRRNPLKVIDFSKDVYYNLAKNVLPLPTTTVLFPLMEDFWSAYAEVSIYFFMARSTFSNEYSFYNNPYRKVYARIDVDTPPFGETPYEALVSVSEEGKIYQLKDNGNLAFWADVNFAAPYQKGLAIDDKGWAYTENAASESKFAGKIFAFVPDGDQGVRLDKSVFRDDFRSPWLGTIRAWSNFGFQIGLIYPVSMADLCYGFMPRGDFKDGLFILEQSFSDIRFLPTDGSKAVAMPLNRIDDRFPEVVPLNEFSRCVYNWEDGSLYFSSYDEIKRLNLTTYQLDTYLSGHLEEEDKRRLLQVSGFAFDQNDVLYLTDFYLQAVYVYLREKDLLLPIYSLKDNQASPVDLAISPDDRSLLVGTNRGLYILPKLVPYKVISSEEDIFQGVSEIEVNGEKIFALAKQDYLLAPIYQTTYAYYRDPSGKCYLLFFDADSYHVRVKAIPSLTEGTNEEVEIKPLPPIELDGALNYVAATPEGGSAASCLVPQVPFEGYRFIKVLSPVSGIAVAPNFHVYAVVSRGISRVEVLLDYQPYREITVDPNVGACLDVPFQELSPGHHVVILKDPEAGIKQVLMVKVTSSPTKKVLAGVVVEAETNLPLSGLEIENPATGQKTKVGPLGVYRLVVPKETNEHVIMKSPE